MRDLERRIARLEKILSNDGGSLDKGLRKNRKFEDGFDTYTAPVTQKGFGRDLREENYQKVLGIIEDIIYYGVKPRHFGESSDWEEAAKYNDKSRLEVEYLNLLQLENAKTYEDYGVFASFGSLVYILTKNKAYSIPKSAFDVYKLKFLGSLNPLTHTYKAKSYVDPDGSPSGRDPVFPTDLDY